MKTCPQLIPVKNKFFIVNLDSERTCERNRIFGPKLLSLKKLSSVDMESEFHELDNSV